MTSTPPLPSLVVAPRRRFRGQVKFLLIEREVGHDVSIEFPRGIRTSGDSIHSAAEAALLAETGFDITGRVVELGGLRSGAGEQTEFTATTLGEDQLRAHDVPVNTRWVTVGEMHGLLSRGRITDAATVASLTLLQVAGLLTTV
ncbi:hypothetical protein [Microbacterium sp. 77mftsu3.1]|uniref:hypothetical protein n=1 Tax=Microbacterium sp. 77mftsu3.1 TaxID=1761802 RepID=UPI00037AB104|nr:hypothetical protein [Microbacterium sp. 77mftsu3.1]SDH40148.1 hypothetical protein SAMN04488590_3246 [Microbacterium sp. 77mftsu3.1]